MFWKNLLWVFAYPIYQVIGTFRHETGHALAAIAFGGVIEEFVFLPTEGYWGYVRWDGPHNLFTTGAPYLLDLLTFLIFFVLCMQLSFRRRWIWLNLVIIGVFSPLINSAYNYRPNPDRINDVDVLLRDGSAIMVHAYFILTLILYFAGLYILFTRARIHNRQPPVSRTWTVAPLLLGTTLLISACSSTLISSFEPEELQAQATTTEPPDPSPAIRSATKTPTMTPEETYETIFRQVVTYVAGQHPQRAPINDLEWDGGFRIGSRDPDTMEGDLVSGDWKFRLFDWDAADPSDAVDVGVWNPTTFFTWTGSATLEHIDGQLRAGGRVPKPDSPTGKWLTYTNSRYGYRFEYPFDVDVIEHGISSIEISDIPEGMTYREYMPIIIREMGPNLCAQVILGEGYIWIDSPENFVNQYNFCQRLGPGAPGWSYESRTESVLIEGQEYVLEGKKLINLEGPDHDEALRIELPSGLRIEVGAYTQSEEAYQQYRGETLPVLIAILETFETIPGAEIP